MAEPICDRTGLTEEQKNIALANWTNERIPGRAYTAYPGRYEFIYEDVMTETFPLWTRSLDSMALITAAMTPEEKGRFEFQMISVWRTDESTSGRMNIFMLEADAPTRAIAAILALGLEKKE